MFNGWTVTLLPATELVVTNVQPTVKTHQDNSQRPRQALLTLPKAAFEADLWKSDVIWALVATPTVANTIAATPGEFKELLSSFVDVLPSDLPTNFPPLCDI